MGKKKKDVKQSKAVPSMQDLVADANLMKLAPFIHSEMQKYARAIEDRQKEILQGLYIRTLVLEELLADKFEDVTTDSLAMELANKQDASLGLKAVLGAAQKGDRVRIELSTKFEEQDDYQGTSRMLIDNLGSNMTLGDKVEPEILGMSQGEEKTISVKHEEDGVEKTVNFKIKVNLVSRVFKEEEKDAE